MRAEVPYIDQIWRVKSFIELDEPLTSEEVFQRLDPLLQAQGTEVQISGNTLTYAKTNPNAQDKLATFTAGSLTVEDDGSAGRLSFNVTSTALFLCFLAPLLFLAIGQFAALINEIEKPGILVEMAEKEAEEEAEPEEKAELHWIDQMLGAPEPKQPGEEDEGSSERESARGEDGEEEEEIDYNHSPETAYVFAGIFLAIFLVGRVLEPYLLKRTLRAALRGPESSQSKILEHKNEASEKPAQHGEGVPNHEIQTTKTGGSNDLQHQPT